MGILRSSPSIVLAALVLMSPLTAQDAPDPAPISGEYSKHFGALHALSVAVARAMPSEQYTFRPHPESMTFGELISHIATTNYLFCAGLKDSETPALPAQVGKEAIVKLLSDSFEYCSSVIPHLTGDQLRGTHNSPDGRLTGREILLAMYVHVAHHRGQAEIYLRDRGIKPPPYRI